MTSKVSSWHASSRELLTSGHDHQSTPRGFEDPVRSHELEERVDPLRLGRHLDNDRVVAQVDNLAAKLLGEELDPAQVLVLLPERLARAQPFVLGLGRHVGVDRRERAERLVDVLLRGRTFLERVRRGENVGTFVRELVLKVLGPEDRNLGEQQFSLDRLCARVVEDGPNGDLEGKNRTFLESQPMRTERKKKKKARESKDRTRSSSCLLACSITPSCPLKTMHIRLRSSISVAHTTSESMLNPRAARMPDTRESTPGSFCTRQLSVCLVNGCSEGGGAGEPDASEKGSTENVLFSRGSECDSLL